MENSRWRKQDIDNWNIFFLFLFITLRFSFSFSPKSLFLFSFLPSFLFSILLLYFSPPFLSTFASFLLSSSYLSFLLLLFLLLLGTILNYNEDTWDKFSGPHIKLSGPTNWAGPYFLKIVLNWEISFLSFSSVQSLSRVQLFVTPWIAARQAPLSITNSWSLPKLMSIESVMPSNYLILCRPLLLLPPIPPSIRVFSNESALPIR